MKDEPRIFAPAMVRALWDGHKLETRRMLSPRNTYFDGGPWPKGAKLDDFDFEAATIDYGSSPNRACGPLLKVARRGADTVHRIVERTAPGDRWWVKENWQVGMGADGPAVTYQAHPDYFYPDWLDQREFPYDSYPAKAWTYGHWLSDVLNRNGPWNSSQHTPRWASRMTLIVTGTKIQRLQDITEDEAIREGATSRPNCSGFKSLYVGWSVDWSRVDLPFGDRSGRVLTERDIALGDARHAFGNYVNKLHDGERWNLKPSSTWDRNPWVIATSFRVIKANIDSEEARLAA